MAVFRLQEHRHLAPAGGTLETVGNEEHENTFAAATACLNSTTCRGIASLPVAAYEHGITAEDARVYLKEHWLKK